MSFILDALKKSETERLRKRTPDISDVPIAAERRGHSRWLWAVAALLLLNAVVLGGLLLRPPAPAPAERASAAAPAPATAATPGAAAGRATSGPSAGAGPAAAPATDPGPSPGPSAGASTPAAAVAGPSLAPATPVTGPGDATAPAVTPRPLPPPRPIQTFLTYQDVKASGAISLPDLHIDLHVYSDSPADRFVFINMNQYRESAVLSEGPLLREITPEGAVLEYLGTTFLLPRD